MTITIYPPNSPRPGQTRTRTVTPPANDLERGELLEIVAALLAEKRAVTAVVRHPRVDDRSRSFATHRLTRVNGAIRRLVSGSFNVCVNCGSRIGIDRLRIAPFAERCTSCIITGPACSTTKTVSSDPQS